MILLDTSIWSLALRRRPEQLNASQKAAVELAAKQVSQGLVKIIGPIRQELLSGVRDKTQFETLRDRLRDFPDEPLQTSDFEQAASFFNGLQGKGIATTHTDCLIASVAFTRKWAVSTSDRDFAQFGEVFGVEVLLHS